MFNQTTSNCVYLDMNYVKICYEINLMDINTPKITFIITVYNLEKYVFRMLDSLINQSDKRFKTIVCNDGSTDSSLSILKSYQEKFSNKNIPFVIISKKMKVYHQLLMQC